jgi:WD40 repeat protein
VHLTISSAPQFAAGEALTGAAAILASSVLRGAALKKWAGCAALFAVLSSLTVSAGLAMRSVQRNPDEPSRVTGPPLIRQSLQVKGLAAVVEAAGDSLPSGVVRRIGSGRFRHNGVVSRVVYTPDANGLVSTSYHTVAGTQDGSLYFWDAATGKLRWRLVIPELGTQPLLAVSSNGKKIAVANHKFVRVVSDEGKELTHQVWPLAKDEFGVSCPVVAPDFGSFACGFRDGTVRLFDSATGAEKLRMAVADNAQKQYQLACTFSADGAALYVWTSQKAGIGVFDTRSGQLTRTLECPEAEIRNGTYPVRLFQKDHFLAALGEPGVIVWDLTTGKQSYRLEKLMASRWLAFAPDASVFALGRTAKEIIILDTVSGREKRRLPAHETWGSLAFAPNGKTLAVADHGGCIDLWDLASGKLTATSPEPNGSRRIRFSRDGKEILSHGNQVAWWAVATGQRTRQVPRAPDWYWPSASVSPDGKLMAASLEKSRLVLLDTATGNELLTLKGHTSWGTCTIFSPDGTKLFSAGLSDPRVLVWDVGSGKLLQELQSHTAWVSTLAISPDGRWLASQAGAGNASPDFDIRLWEVATGKLPQRLKPKGSLVRSMVFSPDSATLIAAGEPTSHDNAEIQFWEVATGKEVRSFIGPKDSFYGLAISPDSRMLALGGDDLQLWEIATGQTRVRFSGHEGPVYSVDFSPDGRWLAAASSDAPIYLWDVYGSVTAKPPQQPLDNEDRARLWRRLANANAAEAFAAIRELVARPNEAVELLMSEWQRLPRASAKQVHKWLKELDSEEFSVRDTATKELERYAADHEDLLREVFKKPSSLEARQRLARILSHIDPQRVLRRTRMLEVLEQLHTGPAREFLRTLAEQREDTGMAREAAAALKRVVHE